MRLERAPFGAAAVFAAALCLVLPAAACDREDQDRMQEDLNELGEKAEEAIEEARPKVEEGVREAGEAVGKGLEVAGEVIQKGGEELQEDLRDTTATTLPDTVKDTILLKDN